MGVFDSLIQVGENGEFVYNQWIEWDHFGIPNKPEILRKFMRKLMAFFKHCSTCTALDGCYFLDTNKPLQPLHPNCDCKKKNISFVEVKRNSIAILPISKFNNYIFNGEINSKGKQTIFEMWGYNIKDINYLKQTFEEQAKENYNKGRYILKKLDEYGQRLAISINLSGHEFNSGWMIYPEGKIINTTPFGGWIR